MSPHKIPDDYVDVAQRIREFKERYPNGSLQAHHEPRTVTVDGKYFLMYAAAAYRTPDDERPGIGYAWEPVPGPTPFTKDSELMNAETSAWGRAIVALGFETKKIASANEVRNRQGNGSEKPQEAVAAPADNKPTAAEQILMTPGQKNEIRGLIETLEKEMPSSLRPEDWTTSAAEWSREQFSLEPGAELNKAQAQTLIVELENWLLNEQTARAGAKA